MDREDNLAVEDGSYQDGDPVAFFGSSPIVYGGTTCGCETTGGAAFSFLSGNSVSNWIKSGLFLAAVILLFVVMSSDNVWAGWVSLALFIGYCIYDDLISTGIVSLGIL